MSEHFRVEPDAVNDLVRIIRTGEPMPAAPDEIRVIYAETAKRLAPYTGKRALIDLRGSPPGRNDDTFEAVAAEATSAMARTFSRIAVLVRSAVGKLQVRRLSGNTRGVFQDEAEAIRYLHEK